MIAAAAHYDVRALGEALDRAVHRTFGRFVAVVTPFVLADAFGNMTQLAPLSGVVSAFAFILGMLVYNRAQVVMIETVGEPNRRGPAWAAAFRHRRALVFALIAMLDYAIPFLAVGVVAVVYFAITSFRGYVGSGIAAVVVFFIVVVIALALATMLLVVLLIFVLSAAAATLETVLDGTAPHRSLGRWLRHTFRWRELRPTLLAAAVFALLVLGVPGFLAAVFRWGPDYVRLGLYTIPEGIADAIALMFAWEWRDLILTSRQGHDIEAVLESGPAPLR